MGHEDRKPLFKVCLRSLDTHIIGQLGDTSWTGLSWLFQRILWSLLWDSWKGWPNHLLKNFASLSVRVCLRCKDQFWQLLWWLSERPSVPAVTKIKGSGLLMGFEKTSVTLSRRWLIRTLSSNVELSWRGVLTQSTLAWKSQMPQQTIQDHNTKAVSWHLLETSYTVLSLSLNYLMIFPPPGTLWSRHHMHLRWKYQKAKAREVKGLGQGHTAMFIPRPMLSLQGLLVWKCLFCALYLSTDFKRFCFYFVVAWPFPTPTWLTLSNTHLPLCQVVQGAKVVPAGEMFVLILSFTPGVSQVLTQPSAIRRIVIFLPSSYVSMLTPYFLNMLPHFEFLVENEVTMRPPGWALIQDGCCAPPPKKWKT